MEMKYKIDFVIEGKSDCLWCNSWIKPNLDLEDFMVCRDVKECKYLIDWKTSDYTYYYQLQYLIKIEK